MSRAFQRIVAAVENTAAAALLVVTVLSFSAVVARYVFNTGIPDAFDGARYLLGVVIFWGLASTCYRGDHITMDAVWALSPKRLRWVIDVLSNAIVILGLAFLLWKFTEKVVDTWTANHGTIDLDLPVAGFYAFAWFGLVAAQVFGVVRLVRILRGRGDPPSQIPVQTAD
ncbi:TRAP transporter small permease [Rhodophyticola porphyridii]|uniref:TRAP transporter small permease protein n=1 Tax=Rhodophyticola porphyridii TaxID=1852017 RepID=A0A3L9Y3L5_9RHOB|nr:TRAP transporter small permease [Rhodophyticola porphyridii]RMA40706.1 TRAP transporter small permease [Rhodophyticola porphyridii]